MTSRKLSCLFIIAFLSYPAFAQEKPEKHPIELPKNAKLVLNEDWSTGQINPKRWYLLNKRWGSGNNGVVRQNVRIERDTVNGKEQNVLICQGHGDLYDGDITGWQGNKSRVGGVIVSKEFFASGLYEVVMKIGSTQNSTDNPENPTRPTGMIPAIWTYGYRWVPCQNKKKDTFDPNNPLYNPLMDRNNWGANEYWSEIDFPEFGKAGNFDLGLYNTFLNLNHQSLQFKTTPGIDGQYHKYTTIWRTHLRPMENIRDDQVTLYKGYWFINDKSIDYELYRCNPLKKLGPNNYALYEGTLAEHYIDDKKVGENKTFVPAMAAQLNIGVWFPNWAGPAPWAKSSISIASVKVFQFYDDGDVRDILTDDISSNIK